MYTVAQTREQFVQRGLRGGLDTRDVRFARQSRRADRLHSGHSDGNTLCWVYRGGRGAGVVADGGHGRRAAAVHLGGHPPHGELPVPGHGGHHLGHAPAGVRAALRAQAVDRPRARPACARVGERGHRRPPRQPLARGQGAPLREGLSAQRASPP
eukprot:9378863-Pyramimonas_sp.AAC.1